MRTNSIKLILFDLGGVLIELGQELFPRSWFAEDQKFELADWFSSPQALKFETGLISTEDFICELKEFLSMTASNEEILAAFRSWPKGFYPSTDRLLDRLKSNYQIAVLSNSNVIHEPIIMEDFDLENKVNDVFFSHLIGHAKPSHAAFNHVLKSLKVKPSEVVFFDDNSANVTAALELGMQAFRVSNPCEINKYI